MLDDEDDNNKSRMSEEGVVGVDENHPTSSAHPTADESDERPLSYLLCQKKEILVLRGGGVD